MPHAHPLLEAILVFLVAGIAGIALARALGVSTILGFFAAGALIGPHGFAILPEAAEVHVLAELGVAFLLFDVGTHLSFKKIWQQRGDLFGFGSLQVAATAALGALAAGLAGATPTGAIVIGCGIALSSTAVVVQVLAQRGEHGGPLGRRAVAILVFQDLFVVLLLVVVPALGGTTATPLATAIALALAKVALAFGAVSLLGRYLLQPAFRWITAQHSDELFTFAALTLVLLIAFGASALGLSLPLGAFLAGLMLAESRFAPVVQAELTSFRALLLSLFFVSVGMGLDLAVFAARPLELLAVVAALVVGKALVVAGIGRVLGLGRGYAVRLGAVLAQGSEFGFVLFGAVATLGLLDAPTVGLLGAAIGVSLAITPWVTRLGAALAVRIEKVPPSPEGGDAGAAKKIVVVGFDDFARRLCRVFCAARRPYVAMASDHALVAEARCLGFEVEFGSPERPRALAMAAVGEAGALVIATPSAAVARLIVTRVRTIGADLPVFAATDDLVLFEELRRQALCDVVIKSEDALAALARSVLAAMGTGDDDASAAIEAARLQDEPQLVSALG